MSRDRAAEAIEAGGDRFAVATVADAEAALATVDDSEVDCVVRGDDLPERDGVAFLRAVRDRAGDSSSCF
jgi:DNA-binding response OmpR family regulator